MAQSSSINLKISNKQQDDFVPDDDFTPDDDFVADSASQATTNIPVTASGRKSSTTNVPAATTPREQLSTESEPLWEQIYKHVFDAPPQITDAAHKFGDYMSQPSEAMATSDVANRKMPFIGLSPNEAMGFIGGATEGLASQLSPANLISTLTPQGRLASIASKILGGAQVAHGVSELGSKPYEGIGDIAFGALNFGSHLGRGKTVNEAVPGAKPAEPESVQLPEIVPEKPAVTSGTMQNLGIEESSLTPTISTESQLPVPTQKLFNALDNSTKLNKEQSAIYTAERAEKFKKAEGVKVTSESDLGSFFSKLKGEHSKVSITPLHDTLDQTDADDLMRTIGDSKLSIPEKANAFTGLSRLLNGDVPRDYEITMLSRVFGEDIIPKISKFGRNKRSLIQEAVSLPKGLKSPFDVSFLLRQGINYAGRPDWFKTWLPMIKSFGSTKVYNATMQNIRNGKLFDYKVESGLSFGDLGDITKREEEIMSRWAETGEFLYFKPLQKMYSATYGAGVRAGNRAYTIAANVLRDKMFDTVYKQYKTQYQSALKLAKSPEEIKSLEVLNPDNLYRGKLIADMVNVGTGRGSIGKLEAIAPELNAAFFAPRLISARVRSINRILNPASYYNSYKSGDKVAMKEAVKQFFSILGTATSTAAMYKMAGFDVSFDPDSSDFMKIRKDNTRMDPLGGYQQYFVPAVKILTNHATTTVRDGIPPRRYELGKGAFAPDGLSVLGDAARSKASPFLGLAASILAGQEMSGEPINLGTMNPMENTVSKALIIPFLADTIYEVYKEDPELIPLIIPPAIGGMGVQSYGR